MRPELVRLSLYPQPYLGTAEFAEIMGVSKQLLQKRLSRGHVLEPTVRLRMGPVWAKEAVAEWLRRNQ